MLHQLWFLNIKVIPMSDTITIPVEPDRALLASMAMRYRHDFGLLDKRAQESLISTMRQIHEEVVGKGFYSPQQRERYMRMLGE
jgi:predicted nucleic acid-binding protein